MKTKIVFKIFLAFIAVLTFLLLNNRSTGSSQASTNTDSEAAPREASAADAGSWQCWGIVSPAGCGMTLNDAVMLSPTDGWAVGDGIILRWNGARWVKVSSPVNRFLTSIHILSPTDGWAVGWNGTILRWNGTLWSQVLSPTTSYLEDITMLSATDGWAVGWSGTILRWNVNSWSTVTSPKTNSLNAVAMVSTTDGWAVGSSGTILRWNGSSWSSFSSPTTRNLEDITLLSATDGWAVGSMGTILRWNGTLWSQVSSPSISTLYDLSMLSATDGWAVGWSDILHWNGSSWSTVPGLDFISLNAAAMASTSDGWAVGWYGTILRWNGSTWSLASSMTTKIIGASSFSSATNGWAVGENGLLLHWDIDAWSAVTSPVTSTLSSIQMLTVNNGWAVGGLGKILHWNGSAWATTASPTTKPLNAVSFASAISGWAVGDAGTLIQWDGASWKATASPTTANLFAVAALSEDNAWAAGRGGALLHWDGAAWAAVLSPVSDDLTALAFASEQDGWAAASYDECQDGCMISYLLHWDGSAWTKHEARTFPWIRAIGFLTSSDGWVAGDGGYMAHWDGAAWSDVPKLTDSDLYGLAFVPSFRRLDGWAVGDNGVLLRFSQENNPVLTISHIEVTQAIQLPDNSVPLSAGKDTFVRVYLDCSLNCTEITGELHGYRDGVEIEGSSPRASVNRSVSGVSGSWTTQQGDLGRTLNFYLPPAWTTGTITLVAQVGSAQKLETVTFRAVQQPRVAVVPVRYTFGGVDKSPNPSILLYGHWWADKIYPAEVHTEPLHGITWTGCLGKSCNWYDKAVQPTFLLLQLRSTLCQYNKGRPLADRFTYIYGWLPDATFAGGGSNWYLVSAMGDDLSTPGADGEPLGPMIFAHEIGHLLGRGETKAGTAISCENPAPEKESDWPYANATIQNWGLDGNSMGWQGGLPTALKNPANTYDVMSYCYVPTDWRPILGQAWISPHTFSKLSDVLQRTSGVKALEVPSAPEPYLIVSGMVFTDGVTILNPFWVITDTVAPVNPPVGSAYCLEAQDEAGAALATQCMDLAFEDESGNPVSLDGFYVAFANPADIQRIVLKRDSQELAARAKSANAPLVKIDVPAGGETWSASGSYTVTWTASDLDLDPLTYQLLYSPNGLEWVPVSGWITQTQVTVNAAELAGGMNARLSLQATDGMNTGEAESAEFSVETKAPQVFIQSPGQNLGAAPGTILIFQAYAFDLEDGELTGNALRWHSSRDGDLGTGSTLLASLSPGIHVITLTGTDSNGNTGTATRRIFAGSAIYLPFIRR